MSDAEEGQTPWGNATVRAVYVDGGKNVAVRCVCAKGVEVHEQQFNPHPDDIVLDGDPRPTDGWSRGVEYYGPAPDVDALPGHDGYWSWWLDGSDFGPDDLHSEGRAPTEAAASRALEAARQFWDGELRQQEEQETEPVGFPGVQTPDGH